MFNPFKLKDTTRGDVRRLQPIITAINRQEPELEKLTNDELREQFAQIKEEIQAKDRELAPLSDTEYKKKSQVLLDGYLPQVFAFTREAAKRTLGLRHYDVQLMGGMVLHQGKIAEMKTGEGKTLVATLPLVLNALLGKGAHLVTVNDYLAKLHAGWNGPLYHLLGLSTAYIGHDSSLLYDPSFIDETETDPKVRNLRPITRQEAYAADITYGTNNEFGFDYLRDHMEYSPFNLRQRPFHFAIVDEVDSILIDEARTPLIISGPAAESASLYATFAQIVATLRQETDYTVDEKARTVAITDDGITKVERALNIDRLYEGANIVLVHHLEEALKAKALFKRNKDYIIKDGEVIIVDEFTGRLMPGRRYSEGLHQAIEAKEGVEVKRESETLATISFQNLFRLYPKLAGMTGTAATEAEEFWKIYELDVVVVPTHRPVVRADMQDMIYKTEAGKMQAVLQDIIARQAKGQPVLVGTISVAKSERLSRMLNKAGISHQVLNAKYHEREAKVILDAGKPGTVTVATNMAGRGVDILLGGAPPERKMRDGERKVEDEEELGIGKQEAGSQAEGNETKFQIPDSNLPSPENENEEIQAWEKAHQQVLEAGGLHVIGTERHESRRIDNQLRGRAGRQGDPGSTVFYVSMEDDLMRIFGGERLKGMMDRLGLPEDQPIQHGMISRSLESAQKRVEGHNFDIRKHLVEYDDVMTKHREVIYRKRQRILSLDLPKDDGSHPYEGETWLHKELTGLMSDDEYAAFEDKIKQYGLIMVQQAERFLYLRTIDQLWIEHLNQMEELRHGIGLRGYGQVDPLVEYKREAYAMFERLLTAIETEVVQNLLRMEIGQPVPQAEQTAKLQFQGADEAMAGGGIMATSDNPDQALQQVEQIAKHDSVVTEPIKVPAEAQVGRNDPCPCGAKKADGTPKKYKHCHGK